MENAVFILRETDTSVSKIFHFKVYQNLSNLGYTWVHISGIEEDPFLNYNSPLL